MGDVPSQVGSVRHGAGGEECRAEPLERERRHESGAVDLGPDREAESLVGESLIEQLAERAVTGFDDEGHAVEIGDLTEAEASAVFPRSRENWWKPGVVHHAAGHRDHLHVRVRCER